MTKSLRRLVLQLSAMKRYDFGAVSKAQNLAEKFFFLGKLNVYVDILSKK